MLSDSKQSLVAKCLIDESIAIVVTVWFQTIDQSSLLVDGRIFISMLNMHKAARYLLAIGLSIPSEVAFRSWLSSLVKL